MEPNDQNPALDALTRQVEELTHKFELLGTALEQALAKMERPVDIEQAAQEMQNEQRMKDLSDNVAAIKAILEAMSLSGEGM